MPTSKYTFPRPLLDGQDPWLIPHNGSYLLIQSINKDKAIAIFKFDSLHNANNCEKKIIWEPCGDHACDIWAPELHSFPQFSDKWYVYYAACDGNNGNHRMYVLESDTSDPLGKYHEVGKLWDQEQDCWAIDLTVFQYNNRLYAVWSGWEKNCDEFPQNLYIAPMSNPYTINGKRVLISTPTYNWETSEKPINEGPQVLTNKNHVYIVYSANASWTEHYKLGLLTLTGTNPLEPKHWEKTPTPVFKGNENTIGPGHACFLHLPGYKFPLIAYHCKKSIKHGWEREIRLKKFTWSKSGAPVF